MMLIRHTCTTYTDQSINIKMETNIVYETSLTQTTAKNLINFTPDDDNPYEVINDEIITCIETTPNEVYGISTDHILTAPNVVYELGKGVA